MCWDRNLTHPDFGWRFRIKTGSRRRTIYSTGKYTIHIFYYSLFVKIYSSFILYNYISSKLFFSYLRMPINHTEFYLPEMIRTMSLKLMKVNLVMKMMANLMTRMKKMRLLVQKVMEPNRLWNISIREMKRAQCPSKWKFWDWCLRDQDHLPSLTYQLSPRRQLYRQLHMMRTYLKRTV